MRTIVLFTVLASFLPISLAQFSVYDILGRYPELSQMAALFNSSTAFSEEIFSQLTDYTILAPNNDAIEDLLERNMSSTDVNDLLKYHVLFGKLPTANIGTSPMPVRSWLTDVANTNVTDGQRVIVYSNDSGVFFESRAKAASKVVTGDIVGNDGFIHIIDKVLAFPSIFAVTAAVDNLSYLIALMNQGNYLQNTEFSLGIANHPNATFFAPNSAAVHVPADGTQSYYDSLLEYHCVDKLVYSPDLIDGTVLPTFNGSTMVIRVDKSGQAYANNAKIIGTNYLLSNGVMHILDDLMDPNNVTTTNHASTSYHILSMTKRAGIGIGCGVFVIITIIWAYVIFHRRQQVKSVENESGDSYSLHDLSCPPIEQPDDMGKVWIQEPKSILGPKNLEPKSLQLQRETLSTPR